MLKLPLLWKWAPDFSGMTVNSSPDDHYSSSAHLLRALSEYQIDSVIKNAVLLRILQGTVGGRELFSVMPQNC